MSNNNLNTHSSSSPTTPTTPSTIRIRQHCSSSPSCKLAKKCRDKNNNLLLPCSVCNDGHIHKTCLEFLHVSVGNEFDDSLVLCGKRCFNKYKKENTTQAVKKDSARSFWHNDGPNPSISSQSIIIDWLTTGNNYQIWRGGNKHSGVTKC